MSESAFMETWRALVIVAILATPADGDDCDPCVYESFSSQHLPTIYKSCVSPRDCDGESAWNLDDGDPPVSMGAAVKLEFEEHEWTIRT